MGILNITPDSFSDGGEFLDVQSACNHARKMISQGASIIDIGGESTRPGSEEIRAQEELARVLPVVKILASEGICVSIDTKKASVAKECIKAGASIINDVSGFSDSEMLLLAAQTDVGLVVMHMQGVPKNMQDNPQYIDVVEEVKQFLQARAGELEGAGVARNRICLDPGPGFGKTTAQTRDLMLNLHQICSLSYPVMVAVSRKSYLGEVYGIKDAKSRDMVSAQESLRALELGASVVRIHNVCEMKKQLKNLRPFCFLSLGCNVALVGNEGEKREAKIAVLNQVISMLCTLPDSVLIDVSHFYESEPAYFTQQDSFINAVVLIRTGIGPHELLTYLHAIENQFGRTREVKNGPRTCDIDIIDYQLYVCDDDKLTLPHPLCSERDFVVSPLLEIKQAHVLANGLALTSEAACVGKSVKLQQRF